MKYKAIIEASIRQLGERAKFAMDLAELLDQDFMSLDSVKEAYFRRQLAELREKALNRLCAALVQSGLQPLGPEVKLIKAFLPDFSHEGERGEARLEKMREMLDDTEQSIYEVADNELEDSRWKGRALSMINLLMLIAPASDYSARLDKKELMAMLNEALMEMDLPLVRENFNELNIDFNGPSPSRPINVVILDDEPKAIAKTMMAIAGRANVSIRISIYKKLEERLKGDELATHLNEVVAKVMELEPDVILLDEGLDHIVSGADLIPIFRENHPRVRLVGNTGGSGDRFKNAGLHSNIQKGDRLHDFDQLMSYI